MANKSSTRQHSPSASINTSNIHRNLKPKVPSHLVKRKKALRKPQKPTEKLSALKGSYIKYAPKIFPNQIFSDVYDEQGRHDRIMEFELSTDTNSENQNCIFYENVEDQPKDIEGPKPPENSFLEETCQDSDNILSQKGKLDLFAKLELMARDQGEY